MFKISNSFSERALSGLSNSNFKWPKFREGDTIFKVFEKLAKTNLLILDDFGLSHFEKQQQLDLMELVEDRHGKPSTIISSQLPVASWFDIIGEATIADAILDRLVHTSYRLELKGDSKRKKM